MNFGVKKILVPIDFSDTSVEALKYCISFSQVFNAELVLLHVIEPFVYPPDFSLGQIAIPTSDYEFDTKAITELDSLVKQNIPDSVKTKSVIKTGKPFLEIIETAKEEDVDLIIISSVGRSAVEYVLFGSTAEKVVRKAPCPVLTIRNPLKGFDFKEFYNKK